MSNNLLNNLKQMRQTTPDKAYKADLGERLAVRAESLRVIREWSAVETGAVRGSFWQIFRINTLARATAVVSCVLLIAGGGSILTVSAAQNSLPGDFLYGVKLTSEKVQAVVVTSPKAKVKLNLTFANNRLQEAKALAVKNEADSNKKIAQAVQDFQKQIVAVEENLNQMKAEQTLPVANKDLTTSTVAEIASLTTTQDIVVKIATQVEDYKTALNELKTAVDQNQVCVQNTENLSGVVASALASSQKLSQETVVIVDVSSTSSSQEVAEVKPAENTTTSESAEVKKPVVKKPAVEVNIDLPSPERSDNVELKLDMDRTPLEPVSE